LTTTAVLPSEILNCVHLFNG